LQRLELIDWNSDGVEDLDRGSLCFFHPRFLLGCLFLVRPPSRVYRIFTVRTKSSRS
jgi:hypothetical protein